MLATICNMFQLKPICIGHFTLGRLYNARTDGLLTACLFGEHTDVRATQRILNTGLQIFWYGERTQRVTDRTAQTQLCSYNSV